MKTYPAILFFARHGRNLAVALGVLLALAAGVLFAAGAGTVVLVGGLGLALLTWGVVRVGAEVVEVVAETLLPR